MRRVVQNKILFNTYYTYLQKWLHPFILVQQHNSVSDPQRPHIISNKIASLGNIKLAVSMLPGTFY